MKKILIFSILILFSINHAYSNWVDWNSSDMYYYDRDTDKTRKFKNSCGYEWFPKDRPELGNAVRYKVEPVYDYIYFSLSEHFKDKKRGEIDFYKDKSYSGKPAYTLSEKGFLKDGKLTCEWNTKYSEDLLAYLYFPKCIKKTTGSLLNFLDTSGRLSSISFCRVFKIEKYGKEKNGSFWYQVKIGEKKYFMDVRSMPKVKSGFMLSIKKKRGEERAAIGRKNRKVEKKRATKVRSELQIFKKHPDFNKIEVCYKKRDFKCLLGFSSVELVRGLDDWYLGSRKKTCGRDGNLRYFCEINMKCTEKEKIELLKMVDFIFKQFIETVNGDEKYKSQNFSDAKKTQFGFSLKRIFENPRTGYEHTYDDFFLVELKNNNILFSGYSFSPPGC